MSIKINNENKECIIKINPNIQKLGVNGLIGTTSAPLGDCFLGNILGFFSKKIFKKIFLNLF